MQYAPYCDFHEVTNIAQRKAERRRRTQEQINEAMYKATLTLAQLEALHAEQS
jgi:hypothetical protein